MNITRALAKEKLYSAMNVMSHLFSGLAKMGDVRKVKLTPPNLLQAGDPILIVEVVRAHVLELLEPGCVPAPTVEPGVGLSPTSSAVETPPRSPRLFV